MMMMMMIVFREIPVSFPRYRILLSCAVLVSAPHPATEWTGKVSGTGMSPLLRLIFAHSSPPFPILSPFTKNEFVSLLVGDVGRFYFTHAFSHFSLLRELCNFLAVEKCGEKCFQVISSLHCIAAFYICGEPYRVSFWREYEKGKKFETTNLVKTR